MLKTIKTISFAAVLMAVGIVGALAQPAAYGKVEQPWFPQGKISGGISVSNSSTATALPTKGLVAWACNSGSNDAYIALGTDNTVAATAAGSSWLKAGTCATYDLVPFGTVQKYIAAITASSTTTLTVETGIGTGPAQLTASGGGGGSVTQGTTPWVDNITQWNGAALAAATAWGVAPSGNVPGVNANILNSSIQVGGYNAGVAFTPTVQNAAYSSGNAMGGLQTVSFFRSTTQPSGIFDNFSIASKGGATVAMTIYIFDTNPTASTCTDKSAFALNSADASKLAMTPFVLTPAVIGAGTTETFAQLTQSVSVKNQDGTATANLYVCIVAGGSVTPATTSDLVAKISGALD